MKTILVDDELISMRQFELECKDIKDIDLVGKFDNARDALNFARENTVDFALLDVEMPEMNGLELGYEFKKINPDMIIIYVTGHTCYVADTMRMKADYCVMKPYDKQDILDAVMRAKLLSKRFQKRLSVVTFGGFEVYVDGQVLHFSNGKARELFAFCINKEGGGVTMEQAIDILWPDRPYDERVKRLYRKAVNAIQTVLEQYRLSEVFVSNRGCCHVDRDKVDCDLYDFLEEHTLTPQQQEKLHNGYMTEYSWAEARMAELSAIFPELIEEEY